jgi:hypothetical protein
MTRQEHLDWCKRRAIEYIDTGELENAWSSMCSDLQKHDETRDHPAITLGMMLFMSGNLQTCEQMKDFILGFN